jgi:hypothetical protein
MIWRVNEMAQDFEKLSLLPSAHLRRLEKSRSKNLLLYDSKDLVTQAVCIGMTGSGKIDILK